MHNPLAAVVCSLSQGAPNSRCTPPATPIPSDNSPSSLRPFPLSPSRTQSFTHLPPLSLCLPPCCLIFFHSALSFSLRCSSSSISTFPVLSPFPYLPPMIGTDVFHLTCCDNAGVPLLFAGQGGAGGSRFRVHADTGPCCSPSSKPALPALFSIVCAAHPVLHRFRPVLHRPPSLSPCPPSSSIVLHGFCSCHH